VPAGPRNARVPIVGVVAPSGTGKTTLLCRLLPLLTARGLRVGIVKQAREDFDLDHPGKDSHQLRKAGIERLLLTSDRKSALVLEHPTGDTLELERLLTLFDRDALDLILAEGFAGAACPRIELSRGGIWRYYPNDPWLIALATDRVDTMPADLPVLDMNDPAAVAVFLINYANL